MLSISSKFYLQMGLAVLLYPLQASAGTQNSSPNLQDLRAFTEVYIQIRDQYYGSVNQDKIFQHAISGMLADIDPHSSYLTKDQYIHLTELSEGHYAGIGVEISSANEQLEIIQLIDGAPAVLAGVKVGDIITAVNGVPVKGRLISDSLEDLRGEPGSTVELDILRKVKKSKKLKTHRLSIERSTIQFSDLSSHRLIDDYLLVRIKSFQQNTAKQLQTEIENQLLQSPVPGLILDLRDNPGGVLTSGVAVADHFMDQGLIVSTKTRGDVEDMRLSADPEQLLSDIPMVVLVNASTASAAEIVAGALQDTHRATIVGEKSFGKGSVQSVIPLSNCGALKLTTAHYFTPSGRVIHQHGIEPDIVIETEVTTADKDPMLTAALDVLRKL